MFLDRLKRQVISYCIIFVGTLITNIACLPLSTASSGNDSNYKVFMISDKKLRNLHPSFRHTDFYLSCKRSLNGNGVYIFDKDKILHISPEKDKIIFWKPDRIVNDSGNIIASRKKKFLVFSSGYQLPVEPPSSYEFTGDGSYFFYMQNSITKLFLSTKPDVPLLTVSDFIPFHLFQTNSNMYLTGMKSRDRTKRVMIEIAEKDKTLQIIRTVFIPDSPIDLSPDGKFILFVSEYVPPHPEFGTYLYLYEIHSGKRQTLPFSFGYHKGVFVTPEVWKRLNQ